MQMDSEHGQMQGPKPNPYSHISEMNSHWVPFSTHNILHPWHGREWAAGFYSEIKEQSFSSFLFWNLLSSGHTLPTQSQFILFHQHTLWTLGKSGIAYCFGAELNHAKTPCDIFKGLLINVSQRCSGTICLCWDLLTCLELSLFTHLCPFIFPDFVQGHLLHKVF